jgi:ubiquinone/menaquinone biosynthesis C-methylase UbiE
MKSSSVDWSDYSTAYDLMATHNPAYQEIRTRALIEFGKHHFRQGDRIADIGGGTGNFSLDIAELLPGCEVIHVEPDSTMAIAAESKAKGRGLLNWTLNVSSAKTWLPQAPELAGVITVHSLYTIPNPYQTIQEISDKLRPGGLWFICDLGREMKILDWATYLWSENVKRHGFLETLKMFSRGYPVFTANRAISKMQHEGTFWRHESEEFSSVLMSSGLSIVHQSVAYRGYSDLAICVRSA